MQNVVKSWWWSLLAVSEQVELTIGTVFVSDRRTGVYARVYSGIFYVKRMKKKSADVVKYCDRIWCWTGMTTLGYRSCDRCGLYRAVTDELRADPPQNATYEKPPRNKRVTFAIRLIEFRRVLFKSMQFRQDPWVCVFPPHSLVRARVLYTIRRIHIYCVCLVMVLGTSSGEKRKNSRSTVLEF